MNAVTELKLDPSAVSKLGSIQGGAGPPTSSATSSTRAGTVFSVTPGLPQLFKSNFDYQLARGMLAGAYGDGGAVGESFSTARRIKDKDIELRIVQAEATAAAFS